MELYGETSYAASKLVTEKYSTSFSMSTRLFDVSIRPAIYAVYGLVRIADEIVDTYRGQDAEELLRDLEANTYAAIERGYDTNPIVHAFALTARKYSIEREIIQPFFDSMAMDLHPMTYDGELYETYIYGSAEVVGLMCLKVFCEGDAQQYVSLETGARALGSAYQKINFLRDVAADYQELGRLYFPNVTYETLDDASKNMIIEDIEQDIKRAMEYIRLLPQNSQKAVTLSLLYYTELLKSLKLTPAEVLKKQRVRVSTAKKILLLGSVYTGLRKA